MSPDTSTGTSPEASPASSLGASPDAGGGANADPGRAASPSVSVIVPVKDDAARLELCLAAVAVQDYPGDVQVVVVDNGSAGPGELDVARRWGAVALRETTPGSYAARNAALGVATGEVLAFTDADCLPRRDWLRRAVGHLRDAGGGPARPVVAGAVRVYARDAGSPSLAEAWDVVRGLPQRTYAAAGWGATANLVAPRHVLDAVGPFATGLRSGGDAEWGRRASAAGCRVVYAADAVVDHPARQSMPELVRKLRRVHRGARERAALGGPPPPGVGQALFSLRPPLGAVRLAARSPALPTLRAKASFVAAESVVRLVGAWLVLREAARARR